MADSSLLADASTRLDNALKYVKISEDAITRRALPEVIALFRPLGTETHGEEGKRG
jgi:hypothetical protein